MATEALHATEYDPRQVLIGPVLRGIAVRQGLLTISHESERKVMEVLEERFCRSHAPGETVNVGEMHDAAAAEIRKYPTISFPPLSTPLSGANIA